MNVFSDKVALYDTDLEKFFSFYKIPAEIFTLEDLNQDPDIVPKYVCIFTGNTENDYNTVPQTEETTSRGKLIYKKQAITKHWIGLFGSYAFDSYGRPQDFKFPFETSNVNSGRLQEYNSAVCGEYVARFLYFCDKEYDLSSQSLEHLGENFRYHCGFSDNLHENDETVLEWFNEKLQASN